MSSFSQNFVKPLAINSRQDDEQTRIDFVTAYSQSLDVTLQQALEAEREAEWWSDIEKSSWNPFLLDYKIRFKRSPRTEDKIAAAKPSFILACFFPHLQQNQSQIKVPSSQLRLLLLVPFYYTRQEIALKRHELLRIRDEQARALGSLVLLRPQFQSSTDTYHLTKRLHQSIDPSSNIADIALFSSHTLASSKNAHNASLRTLARPSRLVRLWPRLFFGPPFVLYSIHSIYASRGTLLDLFRESKDVVKGFVLDWCIKPLVGVLETVKASKGDGTGAGLFISKEGVQADFDSLERMSLSLATDQLNYTPAQLDALSARIRLGDLTPVLKLYEEDIKSPLKSAIGGTLLRTLFIQVQKAKVDLDQALAGIDQLMKSQELTFAFVGLSPALAIVYVLGGLVRRLVRPSNTRRYGGKKERERMFWVMRRVERLLVLDPSSRDPNAKYDNKEDGQPSALTTGLLTLSINQLRTYAERYLPSSSSSPPSPSPSTFTPLPLYSAAMSSSSTTSSSASSLREAFLEDVNDLQDPELGIDQKQAVVERMWRCWGGVLGWGK
ncbi:NCA2-domain-containing protein [Gymnopus androsaceus JB14]|uniref:NCA2-domain-containing protein n=1 Tax=Gymnopus androsaceus JB14 TaxID=1447944 RepID=A0A6A4IBG1_9AGAR|nr:NCA2-domain-containing protein [Gymnopus androsaceus JB14]